VNNVLRGKWLRFVLVVLVLAIPLALLLSRAFGGFVRDVIAAPFVYLVWLARIYIRTVPHALFWGALVLFGLGLAITSIVSAGVSAGGDEGWREGAEVGRGRKGQVEQLATQIELAAESDYFRNRLAQRLREVMLQSMDYEDPYRFGEIEHALDAVEAPPEVRAFLDEQRRLTSPSRPNGLIAWLKARFWGLDEVSSTHADLEDVVRFLEERLEVL